MGWTIKPSIHANGILKMTIPLKGRLPQPCCSHQRIAFEVTLGRTNGLRSQASWPWMSFVANVFRPHFQQRWPIDGSRPIRQRPRIRLYDPIRWIFPRCSAAIKLRGKGGEKKDTPRLQSMIIGISAPHGGDLNYYKLPEALHALLPRDKVPQSNSKDPWTIPGKRKCL